MSLGWLVLSLPLSAQPIDYLEFIDAPVDSILIGLARAVGVPLTVARDVSGTASYFFQSTSFPDALYEFARAQGLYVEEIDGFYRVSSFAVIVRSDGSLDVEAPRADASQLLNTIATRSGTTVIHSVPPGIEVSYVASGVDGPAAVRAIGTAIHGHSVRELDGAISIVRSDPSFAWDPSGLSAPVEVVRSDDRYSINATGATFADALEALFASATRSLHLLAPPDLVLPNLAYHDLEFETLLQYLLEQGNAYGQLEEGVVVVMPATHQSGAARRLETQIFRPRVMEAGALVDLMPPSIRGEVDLRTERTTGLISLTGPPFDVDRVISILEEIDSSGGSRETVHQDLVWTTAADIVRTIPPRFTRLSLTALENGVVIEGPSTLVSEMVAWITLIDVRPEHRLITLSHGTAREFIEHTSGNAVAGELAETADPRVLLHTGSAEAYERLVELVRRLDRPDPVIRYQLLVVESSQSERIDWEAGISNRLTTTDSRQAFLGSFGAVLGLSFDIVSAFGYEFALRLSASMAGSKAEVLADTTLTATSGTPVEFRNTHTFRYRDASTDPTTGEHTSIGITRELTSGLLVSITGEAGPGGIDVVVSAGLSRQGEAAAGGTNPPTTSERSVETRVRVQPGEPIVLSGLASYERGSSSTSMPLIGRIPILRRIFGAHSMHSETTEMSIFLLPSIVPSAATLRVPTALELVEEHMPSSRAGR